MTEIPPIITSFDPARINNAQLMRDVATVGYIDLANDEVLDCTYRTGRFWKLVRPENLTATDLDPRFTDPNIGPVDFTAMPFEDEAFDVSIIDGPYKLNGTSKGTGPASSDESYDVAEPATWWERHFLIKQGIVENVRVTKPGGHIMVKCQDQVCLTEVRWQTIEFARHAIKYGCRLKCQMHVFGSRKQPRDGTPLQSQDHARRNYSTLLILEKRK